MKIALIVCTYMRPEPLKNLLASIAIQKVMPDEIILVDGSTTDDTADMVANGAWPFISRYYQVPLAVRGLTKQRNYGIEQVSAAVDLVAFLDDDLVLEPDYFEQLLQSYLLYPDAIGIGGIDIQENGYVKKDLAKHYSTFKYYELDGWIIKEPARFLLRKILGLMPKNPPGIIPGYSHGRSSFPPNGRVYEVEHFMGGIASFRKNLFEKIQFSAFFEGYGLYEDFDFTVRASRYGKLYVNTGARVRHYHAPTGRPNMFRYGQMVIRNGWYVWRVKHPTPGIRNRIKWNSLALLLSFIRLGNAVLGSNRLDAWNEFMGRISAWIILIFRKPKVES